MKRCKWIHNDMNDEFKHEHFCELMHFAAWASTLCGSFFDSYLSFRFLCMCRQYRGFSAGKKPLLYSISCQSPCWPMLSSCCSQYFRIDSTRKSNGRGNCPSNEMPPSFPPAPYRVQVAHHRQAPRITQVATARYSSMLQLFWPQAAAAALQALLSFRKMLTEAPICPRCPCNRTGPWTKQSTAELQCCSAAVQHDAGTAEQQSVPDTPDIRRGKSIGISDRACKILSLWLSTEQCLHMRRKHCLPLHNSYENAMIWHRSTEWSTFDQIIVLALDRFPEVAARVRNLETHQTTTEINRNFMKLWDEVNPFASPMRFQGVLPSYRTKTCRMPSNAIRLKAQVAYNFLLWTRG